MKVLLTGILILFTLSEGLAQQQVAENTEAHFTFSYPSTWFAKSDGTITDVFSPEEGAEDVWQEYLGVSIGEANGLTLQEAFDYYIKTDFPEYYPEFTVLRSGKETINGLSAQWALCSYGASGTANNKFQSAIINNLFYLILKNDVLYFINGIAVETEYPRFEKTFLDIIRTFHVTR